MTLDPKKVRSIVVDAYGKLPHPLAPNLTNSEYAMYERIAELKRHPHPHTPRDVEEAYNELTSGDISPQQWEHAWAIARPLANRLLGRDPELYELKHLSDGHPQDFFNYYSNLPSPSHPEIKAGDMVRYYHMASEPAGRHMERKPLLYETAYFAAQNASPADINAHYERRAQDRQK